MAEPADIHDLPPARWGGMDRALAGQLVEVGIVCVHAFGVGMTTGAARVLVVTPGRQPTLTIRPSELPGTGL